MARPSKLTPTLTNALCETIAHGNHIDCAAALHGIGTSTFYDWMARGERGDGDDYVEFSDAIKKARAVAETDFVQQVRAAAKAASNPSRDDGQRPWQAAAWWLERSAPKRWALRVKEAAHEARNAVLDAAQQALEPEHYGKLLAALAGKEEL